MCRRPKNYSGLRGLSILQRYWFQKGNGNFASEQGRHIRNSIYLFEIDRYSANKQMMSNWSVYPPPPLPASPTFSPYLPRFSNLSIFSAAAACDCAPLRNRTEVGERERDIRNGRQKKREGEEEGGGGEFAAIIPHPPSITKRENRLHTLSLVAGENFSPE